MWPEKTTRGSMCHYQGSFRLEQDQVGRKTGLILFRICGLFGGAVGWDKGGGTSCCQADEVAPAWATKNRQGRCTRALYSLHLFLRATTPKMALEVRPFGGMREQEQVESACSVY